MENNPYASPENAVTSLSTDSGIFADATNGKRFLNYLLDLFFVYLGFFMLAMIIIFLVAITESTDPDAFLAKLEGPLGSLLNLVLYFVYYTFFEAIFGATIGKFITGTRVVDVETNQKPGFGRIIVRSLCRFIPFEHFSFFSNSPGGWHDTVSKTRTIDKRGNTLTQEEYQDMRSLTI